jgi:hypothetical protein
MVHTHPDKNPQHSKQAEALQKQLNFLMDDLRA